MKSFLLLAMFLALIVPRTIAQTMKESELKVEKQTANRDGTFSLDFDWWGIYVRDSISGSYIDGAVVTVAYKKDTVVKVTGSNLVEFNRSLKDSLSVTITYLGYKPFHKKFAGKDLWGSYDIFMVEDPWELAEVVVVGKKLAMIVRGDTVIYDANKFNTLTGDNLGELIKQMPGLEYNEGTLTFNGERISRISIGGRRLFGNDIQAALANIYAEDVEGIEVYKQQSDVAKHFELENAPLEQVMNVKTKRKITIVKKMELLAEAGQSTPKNKDFDEDVRNRERLLSGLFIEDLQLQSGLEHINSTNQHIRHPNESYQAWLSVNRSKDNAFNISSDNRFNHNSSQDGSVSIRDYFSSDQYTSRVHRSSGTSDNKAIAVASRNYFSLCKGKHNISGGITFDMDNTKSDHRSLVSDITDGIEVSNSDMKSYNKLNNHLINFSLSDYYYFKNGGNISASIHGSVSRNYGDGWRVDTTATTSFSTWLTNDNNGKNISYGGNIGYEIALTKNASITTRYIIDYSNVTSKRASYDNLLLQTDIMNTFDYTLKSVDNGGRLGFSLNNKTLDFNAELGFNNRHILRNERFPSDYGFPRTFNTLLSSVSFNYSFSAVKKFGFNYSSSALDMSIEQLRGVIDNSNPSILKAGNPNLKQLAANKIMVTYDIVKPSTGGSYGFSFNAAHTSNYIAYKTHYFTSDADNYWGFKYPFTQGTTFMIPDNVGGKWDVKAGINHKRRSEWLRSTLSAELNYDYSRTPYIFNEVLNVRSDNGGSLRLDFNSGFSNKITINIYSITGGGYTYSNSDNNSYYFNQQLNAMIRTVIKKRHTFGTNANYNYAYYSAMPDFIRNEIIWNAYVGRKFGKKNKMELTAKMFDILNRTDMRRISIIDNYVQTSTSWFLGRFWTVEIIYKF